MLCAKGNGEMAGASVRARKPQGAASVLLHARHTGNETGSRRPRRGRTPDSSNVRLTLPCETGAFVNYSIGPATRSVYVAIRGEVKFKIELEFARVSRRSLV